jgi:hypothetical protein
MPDHCAAREQLAVVMIVRRSNADPGLAKNLT